MELVTFETVRTKLPGLAEAALLVSPAYEPWILALPAPAVVTVIEQELVLGLAAASVHDGGMLTTAAPPPFVKDTDPVGEYPVTVAVQVVGVPTCTGDGTQPTATLDVA